MDLTTKKRFGIWPAVFNAFTMNNLESVNPDSQVQVAAEKAGGATVTGFSHVESNAPTVSLKGRDIKEALVALDPTSSTKGLVVTSALIQYLKRATPATASHVTLTSTKGFLYVTDFGASQGGKADINCNFAALQNGANEPLVINTDENLTGLPAINTSFGLGPVKFEGVQLRGVQSWRCRTGIQYVTKPDSGDISPDDGTVDDSSYVLEIDCEQIEIASSASFPNAAPMTLGITAWLKRQKQGSTVFGNNDPEHIAVSHAAGTYYTQSLDVTKEGDASTRLICQFDGVPSILTGQTIVL